MLLPMSQSLRPRALVFLIPLQCVYKVPMFNVKLALKHFGFYEFHFGTVPIMIDLLFISLYYDLFSYCICTFE